MQLYPRNSQKLNWFQALRAVISVQFYVLQIEWNCSEQFSFSPRLTMRKPKAGFDSYNTSYLSFLIMGLFPFFRDIALKIRSTIQTSGLQRTYINEFPGEIWESICIYISLLIMLFTNQREIISQSHGGANLMSSRIYN